jgi:two-component system, LuxR family, response regulator FixJ
MFTRPGPVIIVDDDAAVRQSLKFALELEGLDVRLYNGGGELLADDHLPTDGCLIVDYHMPGINGIDLVDQLRGRHIDLPAILITTQPSRELQSQALRSGFRQILEKPLDDSSLLDGIRGALSD